MQPHKVNGVRVEVLQKGCLNKRRFSDEFAARAVGMDLPHTAYVYRCSNCQGWHLTKNRQRDQSMKSDFYLKEHAA